MTPRPHPGQGCLAPSPSRGGEGWGEGACLLALLLAACTTVPPTRFHTLLPPLEARPPAPATAAPWQLLPVTIPAQVDRPQFVLRSADGSLAVLEQERWIAPLADELGGALTDALARRLGPASTGDPWQVAVDVQRFESVPGRLARLDAAWSVRRGAAAPLRCLATLEQPAGADAASLAEAHRRAVQALGAQIGAAVTALQGGATPACGPQT
jgi:uncharacterized lipoprotein YmbA